MDREHALGKCACLEQGETQKNCVPHDTPDRSDDVLGKCNRLNQYRIDADTDHNEEALEPNGEQGSQIVLSDVALFSVSES